jgi:hypothetical protein
LAGSTRDANSLVYLGMPMQGNTLKEVAMSAFIDVQGCLNWDSRRKQTH